MSINSAAYFIIFLPLLCSLLCQLLETKQLSFWLTNACLVLLLLLVSENFTLIIAKQPIFNDFELTPLSLGLEFRLDALVSSFLVVIILQKLIILFYYQEDIRIFLDEKNSKIFYSVYLLHLFSLIGILTTNNLLNLYLFLEIYSCSFLAIFSIAKNSDIAKLSLRYFFSNAAASLLILLSFLAIYLIYDTVNLDIIHKNLLQTQNVKFFTIIASLISCGLVIKFFPFWLYFENLKNSNLFANFFSVDSLFIKANIGIFLAIKFSYLFFSNILITTLLIIGACSLMIYTILRIYQTKHFKLIAIYFCLNNFALILICLALNSQKAMQAAFFYWINFNLINLFLFIFATFLKRKFNTSLINKIFLIAPSSKMKASSSLLIPLKFLLIFVTAFPFTFLFFGNLNLVLALSNNGSEIVNSLVYLALAITNIILFIFGIKMAKILFFGIKNSQEKTAVDASNYWFYLLSFWLIVVISYFLIFNADFLEKLSFWAFKL